MGVMVQISDQMNFITTLHGNVDPSSHLRLRCEDGCQQLFHSTKDIVVNRKTIASADAIVEHIDVAAVVERSAATQFRRPVLVSFWCSKD